MFGQKNNDASQQDTQSNDQSGVITASDNSWQHPGQPVSPSAISANEDSPSDSVVPVPASPQAPSEDIKPTPLGSPFQNSASPSFSSDSVKAESSDEPSDKPDKTGKDDLLDNSQTDLLEIKQKALNELSPLMTHLDQTPEEKFRTLMMMLQASDDQKLVKQVYEAAQGIKDDKVRAQALLDIVNEINYFTTQSAS